MKQCSQCGLIKFVDDFYIDKRTGAPRSHCKSCQNVLNQKWRKANKEKVLEQNKAYQLKHKLKTIYNLTEEEHAAAVKAASGRCQICSTEAKLYIDHSHETSKFRGMLCIKCNSGLGMFEDNVERLRNAITYLSE